jgi:hypothetical protein
MAVLHAATDAKPLHASWATVLEKMSAAAGSSRAQAGGLNMSRHGETGWQFHATSSITMQCVLRRSVDPGKCTYVRTAVQQPGKDVIHQR